MIDELAERPVLLPPAIPADMHRAYGTILGSLALDGEHRDRLRRRGMSDELVTRNQYRTLPADQEARKRLGRRVVETVGEEAALRIPGITRFDTGIAALPCWYFHGSRDGGLLIPCRDQYGQITGMVVGLDAPREPAPGRKPIKYLVAHSEGLGGARPVSPCHVARVLPECRRAVVVEGILKADVTAALASDELGCVLGTPGIGGDHVGLVKMLTNLEVEDVLLAADMDMFENPNVARSLYSLARRLARHNLRLEIALWNPEYNGLDDALAAEAKIEIRRGPEVGKLLSELAQQHEFEPEDQPPGSIGLQFPAPYYRSAIDGELWRSGAKTDTSVAPAVPYPTAILRDLATGEQHVELSWKAGGGWVSRTIPRASVADATKLIAEAGFGMPVSSKNRSELTDYFVRSLQANEQRLPQKVMACQPGWLGDNGERGFLWGGIHIGPNGEDIPEGDPRRVTLVAEGHEETIAGMCSAGTLAGWLEGAVLLKPYPIAMFVLYAGLAAPLLEILNAPGFVVNTGDETTRGKSTVQEGAAAVWGQPDQREPHTTMYSWDSSNLGASRLMAMFNGMALSLDDTKRISQDRKAQAARTIYEVHSGRDRNTADVKGSRRAMTWRMILLSSGEHPLRTVCEDSKECAQLGGGGLRLVELPGPFPVGSGDFKKLANKFTAAVRANYGHAGPEFVRWLLRNRDRWPAFRERKAVIEAELDQVAPDDERRRLAPYTAIVQLAGELMHECFPALGDVVGVAAELWEQVTDAAADATGAEASFLHALSYANANAHRFHGREVFDGQGQGRVPTNGYLGRWDRGSHWKFIAFNSSKMHEVLGKHYDINKLAPLWKKRGWIECDKGRNQKLITTPAGREWCYYVPRAVVDKMLPDESSNCQEDQYDRECQRHDEIIGEFLGALIPQLQEQPDLWKCFMPPFPGLPKA